MKKLTTILLLTFLLSGIAQGAEFKKGICSSELIMTQNLKAPKTGERYVKNGRYHWYTKSTVREAHILQKHLNRLGFNAGKVDGIIGPNTKGAILRMQKFLGTKQDGYVGPKTRALLNNSCGDGSMVLNNDREYSGNLKIAHGEDAIKRFIENTSSYNKRVFGEDILKIDGDNFVEGLSVDGVTSGNPVFSSIKEKTATNTSVSDYSKTNTQVGGVDESDIVKTDGEYIYTISKSKKLFIVNALNPKDMNVVAKISADKNESMREMYVYDKKLILISNYWENYSTNNSKKDKKIIAYPYSINKTFTRVEIYNIENPKNPIKIKKIDFEGNLSESRITNNHLYFVTNKWFYNTSSIMPRVKINDRISTHMFGEDFYYIDEPFRSKSLTSISVLNLNNLSQMSSKRILMPRIGNIYVSKNNFYLTYNKFIDTNIIYEKLEEKISDLVNEGEGKLDSEKSKIEIDSEYKKKIESVIKEYIKEHKNDFDKTIIEKFSLNGTNISVKASGEVSGFSLNQFSMHEDKDENFFIATTNNQTWLPWKLRAFSGNNILMESKNNLYSLDKDLKNLDSIENLAEGERVKSVRFVDGKAYLVTFKQTDPLFNIDISNPKNLKLLGELKIDGFSQYLHPIFKNRLLGIGRDVYFDKYGNQRNGGIKVTLFDVSRKEPKEIKTIVFGNNFSHSEVLNNHKAILISEDKNIAAFPVTLYESGNYNSNIKTGVMLLNISDNNISKISLLETKNNWENKAKRVVSIGDNLYTTSIEKIKSFDLKGKNISEKVFEELKEIITY